MQDIENSVVTDTAASPPQENASAKLTTAQIEKIADENGEAYRRDVFKSTFKMRVQGLWTGGAIGIFFGGGIGALTALSPMLIGASLATVSAMILPVTAIFAVSSMVVGVAAMSAVGLSTGSIVGGKKVMDRKLLLENPTPEMAEALHYQSTAAEKNTFWNKVLPFTRGSQKIFDWKAGLIFTAAGLAVGGLMIAGGLPLAITAVMPAIAHALTVTGATVSLNAVANCMTIAAMGMFGTFFGADIPTIGANMMEFTSDVFSGKKFEHGKGHAPEISKAITASAVLPRSAHTQDSVVFIRTSSTLISPIGSYAGQEPGRHVRKLAEQKFVAMQPYRGSTIN